MAHVHTFGQVAPAAAGIIQYVTLYMNSMPTFNKSHPLAWVQRLAMSLSTSPMTMVLGILFDFAFN